MGTMGPLSTCKAVNRPGGPANRGSDENPLQIVTACQTCAHALNLVQRLPDQPGAKRDNLFRSYEQVLIPIACLNQQFNRWDPRTAVQHRLNLVVERLLCRG